MSAVDSSTGSAATTPAGVSDPKVVPFYELSRLMVVALADSSGRLVYAAQTKPNGPWNASASFSLAPLAGEGRGEGAYPPSSD